MSRHSSLFLFLAVFPLFAGCGTATTPTTPTAVAPPTTGSLRVTVTGPREGQADITVTGPGGFKQGITATATLTDLTPGAYTIVALTAEYGGSTRCCVSSVPTPGMQVVTVSASAVPATAAVTYGPEGN